MNQEIMSTLVQISSSITLGQKKKLEHLARQNANGQGPYEAPYIREGLDLVFQKYGVTDEQIAAAS